MTDSRVCIRGAHVVVPDPHNVGEYRSDRCDVLVAGDTIVRIGTVDTAQVADTGSSVVIEAQDCLVVPGFVDTHRHTWQTVLRGIGYDWSLAQYTSGMHGIFKPHYDPDDIYVGNLLGRIEALNSGITTLLDWSHGITTADHADAAAQALLDSPGRSVFAYGGGFEGSHMSSATVGAELRRLHSAFFQAESDRVTLALGLRGPQYSTIEATEADVRVARELGLRVSVHGGSAGWGRNLPIAQMHERGLLDQRTTVVHCNTLADHELELMAEVGASASISPDAEIQMGFGWPATGRLLDVGIRPSLSIDDCAAVSGDMFKTMHTTLVTYRGMVNAARRDAPDQERLAIDCQDVFEFATIEGARACGIDDRLGTINVGMLADLLVLDVKDPGTFPLNHALGTVVSAGHPGLVRDVLVAGEIVKRDGVLTGVDVNALFARALESRERIVRRAAATSSAAGIRLDGYWRPPVSGWTSAEAFA